ncbi:MAG: T9SS type A sorting domain-containing protein [Bacteroidia bacterium]
MLLCAFALKINLAQAQNFREIDINDLGYSLDIPGVVLNAGQSVDVIINVGKANRPAHDAVGYKIWLQLSSNAQQPNTISPTATYGWLWETGSFMGSTKTNDVYNHTYSRLTKENGYGEVLRVQITAAVNGVWAPSLVQNVGGILIMDNIGIKGPEVERFAITPNPCSDLAKVEIQGFQLERLDVINIQGQVVLTQGAMASLDMSALSPGTYFVSATDNKGRVRTVRVAKY